MQVTPGNIQRGGAVCPPLLLEQKSPVRRPHQAIGAGDFVKPVIGLLFPGMVYQQKTDPACVSKPFQFGYHLIVAGITVPFVPGLPDFLQGVDDDKPGVRAFPDKFLQLLFQTAAQRLGVDGETQIFGAVHPEHPV